jgi:hypothetical protein
VLKSDGELEKIATLVEEAAGLKKDQTALKVELGMTCCTYKYSNTFPN